MSDPIPEKPSRVSCPECKGEDSIGVFAETEAAYNIGKIKDGVVEADYAHLTHLGFVEFVCLECCHRWPVPKWMRFRVKGIPA